MIRAFRITGEPKEISMMKETELKGRHEQLPQTTPSREMDVYRDIERMFDDFFSRGWLRLCRRQNGREDECTNPADQNAFD